MRKIVVMTCVAWILWGPSHECGYTQKIEHVEVPVTKKGWFGFGSSTETQFELRQTQGAKVCSWRIIKKESYDNRAACSREAAKMNAVEREIKRVGTGPQAEGVEWKCAPLGIDP